MIGRPWARAAAVVVGSGLAFATGCGGGSAPTEPAGSAVSQALPRVPERKVLLIGLDGADWDILDPLMARGDLPNLKRLAEGGVRARLRTVTPVLSPVVWTSMATGREPADHGILDFLATDAQGRPVPVTSTLRRTRAMWQILGEAGIPVSITAWWATWPAEPVRGTLVSDRIAYQLFGKVLEGGGADLAARRRGKTWPPDLYDTIEPLIVPPEAIARDVLARYIRFDALPSLSQDDEERIAEFRKILASTRTYEAVATYLLRHHPGGFHAVYNESTDSAAHLFMPFRPPPMAGVDPARAEAFGGVVDAVYREADAMVGRLLEAAGDDWNVLVVSDHGFRHGENRPRTDPRVDRGPGADWHDRFGVLILYGPDVRKGAVVQDAGVLDVFPTLLALYGMPVAEDLDGGVLSEALEPAFLKAVPVRTIPSYETGAPEGPRVAVASDEDQAVMERLEALGYLGGGGSGGGAEASEAAAGPDAGAFALEGPGAWNNEGVTRLAHRDLEGALEAFRKAAAAGGGVQALTNIAVVQILRGEPDAARRTLEQIESRFPGARTLPALRGMLADREGRYEEAETWLRRAVELEPTDARSWSRLGHVLEQLGRVGEALEAYEAAVAANPEHAEAWNYAGNLHRLRGDLEKAEACFRKSLDADPRYPGAYNNLGLVLQMTGRVDEAIALYEKGIGYAPGSALLHNSLGAARLLAGDLDAAEEAIRKALELRPDLAEAWNNLGILEARRGKTQEAEAHFRQALRLQPDFADAHFNLARAELIHRRFDEALASFRRASDLAPRHADSAIGAAETAFRLGDLETAERYFRRARTLRPDSERIRRRLREIEAGRTKDARAPRTGSPPRP